MTLPTLQHNRPVLPLCGDQIVDLEVVHCVVGRVDTTGNVQTRARSLSGSQTSCMTHRVRNGLLLYRGAEGTIGVDMVNMDIISALLYGIQCVIEQAVVYATAPFSKV